MFKHHMRAAIEVAQQNGSVFGVVLAMGNQQLVAVSDASYNQHDPTGHAVLMGLRELGTMIHETSFPGYELYTTVEPCPMCASACVLAEVEHVYYGIKREEMSSSRYPDGFSAEYIFDASGDSPQLTGGVMEKECWDLL